MTFATVNVFPEPVTPSSTWWRLPARAPAVSASIAAGWSPFGVNRVVRRNGFAAGPAPVRRRRRTTSLKAGPSLVVGLVDARVPGLVRGALPESLVPEEVPAARDAHDEVLVGDGADRLLHLAHALLVPVDLPQERVRDGGLLVAFERPETLLAVHRGEHVDQPRGRLHAELHELLARVDAVATEVVEHRLVDEVV